MAKKSPKMLKIAQNIVVAHNFLERPRNGRVRKNLLKDMFIPPQSTDADMNMNTETCSFHQFCMVLAHFQPSTSKTQETDINSRNEVIYGHKGHLRSFQVMSSFMAIQN